MTRLPQIILATCLSLPAANARLARAADPTTADCLSANEASLNARSLHKLREARADLLKCAAPACPSDVRDECTNGVAEINKVLPTIVFEAKDGAGADLVAVKVTMDGEVLADHLDGTALEVDPGAHTFLFEIPGQQKVPKQLVIREGEKDRHEQVVLGTPVATNPVDSGPRQSTAPGATLASSASGATRGPSPRLGGQRIGALFAAGVGVVGIGIGIGYFLESKSKHDSAMQICPDPQCPAGSNGSDLWNQAISAGNVATVAFIVGAVGLAGGAALWFTSKPERSGGGTQIGLGPGTLQLRGSW